MDDFIYGEPMPEPTTIVLLGSRLLAAAWRLRRKQL
jgi:hypothetical protein